jgi:hypothetical protein
MLEFRVTNHSRLFIEGGSLTVELYDASQKYLGLALLSLTNLHPGKSITALAIPIDVDTSHITSFQAQIMMLFDAKANSIGRLFTIEVVDPP